MKKDKKFVITETPLSINSCSDTIQFARFNDKFEIRSSAFTFGRHLEFNEKQIKEIIKGLKRLIR